MSIHMYGTCAIIIIIINTVDFSLSLPVKTYEGAIHIIIIIKTATNQTVLVEYRVRELRGNWRQIN